MAMKDLEPKMENQEADMAHLKEELRQAHEECQKKFNEQAERLHHVLCSLGTFGTGDGLGRNKKMITRLHDHPVLHGVTKAALTRLRRNKNSPSSS